MKKQCFVIVGEDPYTHTIMKIYGVCHTPTRATELCKRAEDESLYHYTQIVVDEEDD